MIPKIIKLKKLKKSLSNQDFWDYSHAIVSDFCTKQIKITGSKIFVTGQENILQNSNILFVSNHQSNFDIPILISYIKNTKGFVAKSELKNFPIVSSFMNFINCVFLDRKNMLNSGKAMLKAINILKNGYCLVLFPEGTRSKTNVMLPFKCASLKLATKSNSTIIPITINGSYKIMEYNKNMIKPADVYITIHKPIETKQVASNEKDLCEKIISTIQSAL